MLNENSFNLPDFLINLLNLSSFPTGTSSKAKFGSEKIVSLRLSCVSICFFVIVKISPEIFFDFKKLDSSLDLDRDFFSCSNFSFLLIRSLFNLSFSLKSNISKSTFRSLNFFFIRIYIFS